MFHSFISMVLIQAVDNRGGEPLNLLLAFSHLLSASVSLKNFLWLVLLDKEVIKGTVSGDFRLFFHLVKNIIEKIEYKEKYRTLCCRLSR